MSSPTADVSVRDRLGRRRRRDRRAPAAHLARDVRRRGAGRGAARRRRGGRRRPGGRRSPTPKDARNRVLVALERNRVVGFAITSPAADPDCDPVADAELMELTVDPGERGKGHGSRLLQAAVDTMRADRFTRAVLWAIADRRRAARLPHRGRLGPRHRAPRARPRRRGHHPGQAGAPAHRSSPDRRRPRPLDFRGIRCTMEIHQSGDRGPGRHRTGDARARSAASAPPPAPDR